MSPAHQNNLGPTPEHDDDDMGSFYGEETDYGNVTNQLVRLSSSLRHVGVSVLTSRASLLFRKYSTQTKTTSMPKGGATPIRMVVVHTHLNRPRDGAREQGLQTLGEWTHLFPLRRVTLYVYLSFRDSFLVAFWRVTERGMF